MSRKFVKPGTKGFTVTNGLSRRNIEAITLEDGDKTGVPKEEHCVLDVGRESALKMLELCHVESPVTKRTKK
jgi:hypothetical protein